MDVFSNLLTGFSALITPQNLLFLLVGVLLGAIVGVLPGLGPTAGIALLIPVTIGADPLSAVIMLAAIYYGAMYGGSITAILLNIPGESASVAATFDGYPLARQGRGGPALVMQACANFIGGISGVILLTVLIGPIALLARSLGPSELFLIVFVGILAIVLIVGKDKVKGAISAIVGFTLGTVGVDLASGSSRFTFGSPDLITGISFVALVIGLYGIAEVLINVLDGEHRLKLRIQMPSMREGFLPTRADWRESAWTFPRATGIGFIVGVIPGAGASVASFIAYSIEKAVSKVKHRFGKGAISGLAAVEASISASSPGAMVPMMALGIPGSAATAVLLGAFVIWGLRPGPLLMTQEPEFAWGLIGSLYLGNIALLIICLAGIPLFIKILRIPYIYLIPSIVVLCAVGTYAADASFLGVWIMLALGIVGVLMKRHGYSPAAAVVAFVLGPMAENSLRQTLIISTNNPTFLLGRPYSVGLIVILLAVIIGAAVAAIRKRRQADRGSASAAEVEDDVQTKSSV